MKSWGSRCRELDSRVAYAVISLYIIVLSLIPLVGSVLALREWVGFDTGAYYYRSERLEVRFTGLPEGVGKPRIYIYIPNSSYKPVMLIDLDDRESVVNGFSFFYDPREIKFKAFNNTLLVNYVFDSFNVTKRIVAYNESIVLGFKSTSDLEFRIVFKGKNYTRVNGVDLREFIGRSVEFDNITKLDFSFENRLVGGGGGSLELSKPVRVIVREDVEGVTLIALEFEGSELEVVVRGYVEPVRVSSLTHSISSLLNHRVAQLLLPLAALIAVSFGWIIWRKL